MIPWKKIVNSVIGFSLLLGLWSVVSWSKRYDPSLLPSPLGVMDGFRELFSDGTLFEHIKVSLFRFLIGYSLAAGLGILLGLPLGWFNRIWGIFEPVVQVLRPISPIAWFPFVVLWFGIGDIPAVAIIFIAAFYPILLATVGAVGKIDPMYLKLAKNFGIGYPQIFWKILFPAAFPYIAIGLHIAIGSAWVFLVAGEMIGAQSGLGFLIIDARNNLRTDLVLAGIILIGVLGLLLDKGIGGLERWIGKKWGQPFEERSR